jgi:hypothetical protein
MRLLLIQVYKKNMIRKIKIKILKFKITMQLIYVFCEVSLFFVFY